MTRASSIAASTSVQPWRIARRIAIAGCAAMLLAHVVALQIDGGDAIGTPISQLSRGDGGAIHTAGLLLFGLAHFALSIALSAQRPGGPMWRWGTRLLIVEGLLVVAVSFYFRFAPASLLAGPYANAPLWLLACVTGLGMGLLAIGLLRMGRGVGVFNLVCLVVWIALMPLFLWVDATWLGAYERLVGSSLIVWVAGLALALRDPARSRMD